MSSLKLKHSGGNSVIIAGPSSNPAADRTINLNDNYAGNGSFVTANSSGNVGIGTASPSQKLHVAGGNPVALIESTTSSGSFIHFENTSSSSTNRLGYAVHDFVVDTNGSERMRIDSSGNVGISKTNPSTVLDVEGTIRRSNGAKYTDLVVDSSGSYIDASHFTQFRTNGASSLVNAMRINTYGDLQIGQNANDCRLGIKQRSSAVDFMYLRDASDNLKYYIHTSGNVYNTNGTYGQISDQSLKENIVDAKSQWNDIKNIKIRNFNFTEASGYDTHTQIGCVAQEVEKVSPKLVTAPREDGIKTVNTSVLYMKAIKALQEAMAKIEVLETKVAALEAG